MRPLLVDELGFPSGRMQCTFHVDFVFVHLRVPFPSGASDICPLAVVALYLICHNPPTTTGRSVLGPEEDVSDSLEGPENNADL